MSGLTISVSCALSHVQFEKQFAGQNLTAEGKLSVGEQHCVTPAPENPLPAPQGAKLPEELGYPQPCSAPIPHHQVGDQIEASQALGQTLREEGRAPGLPHWWTGLSLSSPPWRLLPAALLPEQPPAPAPSTQAPPGLGSSSGRPAIYKAPPHPFKFYFFKPHS